MPDPFTTCDMMGHLNHVRRPGPANYVVAKSASISVAT